MLLKRDPADVPVCDVGGCILSDCAALLRAAAVHLHKSFIELHFGGRDLPQTVSVQACIDGRNLTTVLPGQVSAMLIT